MIRMKQILCDVIENTYPDSPQKDKYQHFYVEMTDKTMKSMHGKYTYKGCHITIYNLYRADDAVIATTIHELAHHVDYCNRRCLDHSKEFYKVYAELLYTALDMKLFTKDGFMEATRDASDSNKVAMLISGYHPKDIGYKAGLVFVDVHNCYNEKDILKGNGYHFNAINKTWGKEISQADIADESEFLDQMNLEYEIKSATNVSFDKKLYICATGNTYAHKELLKENGFFYRKKEKEWRKEGTEKELKEIREIIPFDIALKLK